MRVDSLDQEHITKIPTTKNFAIIVLLDQVSNVKRNINFNSMQIHRVCRAVSRVCSLSRNKKIKLKTARWIKSRNFDIIENK